MAEEAVTTTADSTNENPQESPSTISWGPIEYARIRSVLVGAAVGFVVLVGWTLLTNPPTVSTTVLLVVGLLLLVGGPFSALYVLVAYGESTDAERKSLKQELRPDWSWLRVGWATTGAIVFCGLLWWISEGPVRLSSVAPAVVALTSLLILNSGRFWYSLDPDAETLELRSSDLFNQTWTRQLKWTVSYRRFGLSSLSLFLFSNRGKRWYEGVHFLSVPNSKADAVEDALQSMVGGEPPRRVKRDERIIFGIIGVSMIGVGPFLYLLSSEPALLFISAAPSTLIGGGVILHALRG